MYLQIQELWLNKQCPIINGILFSDGAIEKLELVRSESYELAENFLTKNGKTNFNSFMKTIPNNLTGLNNLTPLCQKTVIEKSVNLIAGEGGWGGDGFVAAEGYPENNLIFNLFFDNSNPFVEIDINDSNIIAFTNLSERWTIPLDSPEKALIKKV